MQEVGCDWVSFSPKSFVAIVDAHFCKSIPKSPLERKPNKKQDLKAHTEESPMKRKAQRPTKKTKEQERSKERNARESDL